MSVSLIPFNTFTKDAFEKKHNLSSDTLKVMLTNSAPLATNTVPSDIVEIAAGNGYSSGGSAATLVSSSSTGAVYKLVLNDVTFTASGGSVGPFRYAVLYNATASRLIGWYDYGTSTLLNDTEPFTVDFDAVAGVFTA